MVRVLFDSLFVFYIAFFETQLEMKLFLVLSRIPLFCLHLNFAVALYEGK